MLIWPNSDSDCISSLTWNSGSQSSYLVRYCLSAVAGRWSHSAGVNARLMLGQWLQFSDLCSPLSLSVFDAYFLFLLPVFCFLLLASEVTLRAAAGANARLGHKQCLRFGDNLSRVLARPSCPTNDLSLQHRLLSRFIIFNWPYRVASMSPINDKCCKWIETITSWDID